LGSRICREPGHLSTTQLALLFRELTVFLLVFGFNPDQNQARLVSKKIGAIDTARLGIDVAANKS
jgi:predicted Kef-type K+ transport protein